MTAPGGDAAGRAQSVRRLELLVTKRLDGLLAGDHHGLLPGPGTEPAEGRPYEVGDDVRRMDWSLTARTDEPHVRVTDADRELTTWIVADGSASLDFGTADAEKRDVALAAVAAVTFLTARAGNRLAAVVTGGSRLQVRPPATGRPAAVGLLHAVAMRERRQDGGGTGATVAQALGAVARLHVRRGLVAVVSDFLEDGWERPLRRLAARHQVVAMVVGDPRERELPPVGLLTLVDPETGRRVEVQTSSPALRSRFAAAAAADHARRVLALRRAGADVVQLSTDRDWLLDVVRFVVAVRRRRSGLAVPVHR